jgi:hypothetical protein
MQKQNHLYFYWHVFFEGGLYFLIPKSTFHSFDLDRTVQIVHSLV